MHRSLAIRKMPIPFSAACFSAPPGISQGRRLANHHCCLNKKRKLPVESAADQSALPPSKHKCCLPIPGDDSASSSTRSLATDNGSAVAVDVKAVLEAIDGLPQVQSAADSNETYSTSSVIKLDLIYEKGSSDDDASTLLSFTRGDRCKDTGSVAGSIHLDDLYDDDGKEAMQCTGEGHSPLVDENSALHECDYLTEHFLRYSNCVGGTKDDVQQSDDELGSFSVRQEDRLSARPPTIDQEFEQYFSHLMLNIKEAPLQALTSN